MLRLFVAISFVGTLLLPTSLFAESADEVGGTLDPEKKLSLGPAPGIQKIQTCSFSQEAKYPWRSITASCQAGKAVVKLDYSDLEGILTGMTIYQASCVDKNSNELADEEMKKVAMANFEKDLAITLKDLCLKKFQEQFGFTPEKNVLVVRRPVVVESPSNKPANLPWSCGVTQVKKYGRY